MRLQRGVRLQGQGARDSINSVRDEIGCVYRRGADVKKQFLFVCFRINITGRHDEGRFVQVLAAALLELCIL